MKISEIKKLTPHEFAGRYPFLQHRGWDTDKMEYYKDYWGAQHFSECPIIKSNVDPNGICDSYQADKPNSETRYITY